METELATLVSDAAQIAKSGRWQALNNRIETLAGKATKENDWWIQLLGALVSENFSEYLALKRAYENDRHGDYAELAWRARNLLEISVWANYCTQEKSKARKFYQDAGRDASDVYDAFMNWGKATEQSDEWLSTLDKGKADLLKRAAAEGIPSLNEPYLRVRNVAAECGIEKSFNVTYLMLSKFAHPTAMRILDPRDSEKTALLRDLLFSKGCLFFVGAFAPLEAAFHSAS